MCWELKNGISVENELVDSDQQCFSSNNRNGIETGEKNRKQFQI